jgi:hypothetical protein
MKKTTLVLATVAALALGSMLSPQQARSDAGVTLLVLGGLGWGWCYITYGKKRVTPLCAWHDHWRAAYAKRK